MKVLTRTTAPIEFIAGYGPTWRQGLVVDHVEAFEAAGGAVRKGSARFGWAVVDGRAYPIVCGELVRVETEDGPVSGRCGIPAGHDGRCDRH